VIGDVILRMDGTPVSSAADVVALLRTSAGPARRELVVLRNGAETTVPVVLQERPRFARNIGVVLSLLAAAFALLYLTSLDRAAVMGCGAVLAVILGVQFGFYDQTAAFQSIRMGTLALLLGMGLVTAALEETGFFAVVARGIGAHARGDWSRLMALMCVTTFVLSALVNNLTTILVILPVTLGLARDLRFDPAPFVVAEIVSSNLGGASSMIGDFPNMLIASEAGRHFHEFLLYMAPPCLVGLAITIWYMTWTGAPPGRGDRGQARPAPAPRAAETGSTASADRGGGASGGGGASREPGGRQGLVPGARVGGRSEASSDPRKMRQALLVLGGVIAGLFFCGRFAVPPATVALAGGFTVLLLWHRAAPRLVGRAGFGDILFFAGLFVLVGSAEASGLLDIIASCMLDLSGGALPWLALALMWGAAAVTMFLNAGPTTALFVPVVAGLGVSESHGLIWWALSLGVCAGSSGTITGATAGPVALTKMEEFLEGGRPESLPLPPAKLSFIGYARSGVPLMLIFLLVFSAYILGLTVWV
jgi:Na+/H+ antiporter NhaD/arsenite permease-like protein